MPNLAMRRPGTQFSADDIDLSWPIGGEREVRAVPEEKMTLRVRRRIAEGSIQITDDKPTPSHDNDAREYVLLTGEEARRRMAEPAGPVTRVVYHQSTPEDERGYNVEVVDVAAAEESREDAERIKRHAELADMQADIAKRQSDAERAAKAETDKAQDKSAGDVEPEPKTAPQKAPEAPVEVPKTPEPQTRKATEEAPAAAPLKGIEVPPKAPVKAPDSVQEPTPKAAHAPVPKTAPKTKAPTRAYNRTATTKNTTKKA